MPKISLITATYNRTKELGAIALPNLLAQTHFNFEWIVVNDGGNLDTKNLISNLSVNFPIVYLETPHVGLCQARNLGLQAASGDIISYLDDDNSIAPNFIEETDQFFGFSPTVKYSMTRQYRQRNVVVQGQLVKSGKVFVSPSIECSLGDLLLMKQLFDSNGFAHYRQDAPMWNRDLKVFADYEYLLQCVSIWGESGFELNPLVLVNYIQTNEGIIGQSNYQQWSEELQYIWNSRDKYMVFNRISPEFLLDLIHEYRQKNAARLTAFS